MSVAIWSDQEWLDCYTKAAELKRDGVTMKDIYHRLVVISGKHGRKPSFRTFEKRFYKYWNSSNVNSSKPGIGNIDIDAQRDQSEKDRLGGLDLSEEVSSESSHEVHCIKEKLDCLDEKQDTIVRLRKRYQEIQDEISTIESEIVELKESIVVEVDNL